MNGLEALNLYREKITSTTLNTDAATNTSSFDVVLMDINMPIMDGLEATREIRALERDMNVRPATIIALTGVASAEVKNEAFISGINLFLIKPVRLADLEVILKGVVTGEPFGAEGVGLGVSMSGEKRDRAGSVG